MEKNQLDALRKGSKIYFVDPANKLQWKLGHVRKRISFQESHAKSNRPSKIQTTRRTFLIVAEHQKPDLNEIKYLIEYAVFNKKTVLIQVMDDIPEEIKKEIGKVRELKVFHSDRIQFHIKWYKFLLRKLDLVENYDTDYKKLASQLRDIVETMRYCLMILQEG